MSNIILNKNKTVPYTYLLGWSKLNKWYYGVRFAKNCNPNDLWAPYKTSSKHVKYFIEQNGDPDIIQIRKVFSNHEYARRWENKVLHKMNVIYDAKWLNETTNKAINPVLCSIKTKGKTYEEMYGIEKALRLRHIRSKDNRKRKLSDITKLKQSKARKGFVAAKDLNGKTIVVTKEEFDNNDSLVGVVQGLSWKCKPRPLLTKML